MRVAALRQRCSQKRLATVAMSPRRGSPSVVRRKTASRAKRQRSCLWREGAGREGGAEAVTFNSREEQACRSTSGQGGKISKGESGQTVSVEQHLNASGSMSHCSGSCVGSEETTVKNH